MMPKERVIFTFQIVCKHFPDMLGMGNRSLQVLEDDFFNVRFCSGFHSLFDLVLKCPEAP